MDLEPAMRRSVRRLIQSLHRFASNEGWGGYAHHADWNQGDYYVDIMVNDAWDVIYVKLVSSHFRDQDRYKLFDKLQDHLRQDLHDVPGLADAIRLVLRDDRQYDEEGGTSLGLGDIPVDEEFVESVVSSSD